VLPIVVNNNNFAKGAEGKPTLLSFDDARTLFHEFGHGLHGLLSNVNYERLSGTNVLRDFVELPSQLFEHWLSEPDVLKRHARHFETGEAIPDALMARLKAARQFNQGFETVEYTASALVDLALHSQTSMAALDIAKFEAAQLQKIGMPKQILMRHRLPHFGHLFSSSGYASQYYVYLWAEVLDADGYEAFVEAGNPFDATTAQRLRKFIYSSGNTLEPTEAYRAFRGRAPTVTPMLKKKGLLTA
jgi:peptidyl-dipeptidase Dcp